MRSQTTQADPTLPFHTVNVTHAERQLAGIETALRRLAVQEHVGGTQCLDRQYVDPDIAGRARGLTRSRLEAHHRRTTLWLVNELGGGFPLSGSQEASVADYAHAIAEVEPS